MPAYATLTELKAWMGVQNADQDTALTRALDAAEAQINAYTGRRFTTEGSTSTRYYTALSAGQVLIDPLQNLTGLTVDTDTTGDGTFDTSWTVDTQFRLAPYNAAALGQPYTAIVPVGELKFPTGDRRVRVVGRFGWSAAPPADVVQATLIQAAFLFKRKDAPFGIAGSAEYGSELRILAALDPTARSLLWPYRTFWVVSA